MFYANTCRIPGEILEPFYNDSYSINTGKVKKLSTLDYISLVGIVLTAFAIGSYQAWKNRKPQTMDEFLSAYRMMSAGPVGLSTAATLISGLTITTFFTDVYFYSTMIMYTPFGILLMGFFAAYIYHPLFYRLQVITVHEYLELRFTRIVRTLTACMYLMHMVSFASVNLLVPVIALTNVTGLSLWGAITTMVLISIAVTALGGMQSLIYVDAFQISVMFVGLFVLLGYALDATGSWSAVLASNIRSNRLQFDEFRLDLDVRLNIYSCIFSTFLLSSIYFCFGQHFVQKTLSCNKTEDVKIAVFVGVISYIAFFLLICILALISGALYENCDPLEMGIIRSRVEIIPLFAMDTLSKTNGLAGLFVSSILFATLSTNASIFNAVATVIIHDIILNYRIMNIKPTQERHMARLFIVLFGLLAFIGSYSISRFTYVFQALSICLGFTRPAVFGVFVLGLFFPWANSKGALSLMFVSVVTKVAMMFTTTTIGYVDEDALRCTRNCNTSIFTEVASNFTEGAERRFRPKSTKFYLSPFLTQTVSVSICLFFGVLVSFATGAQKPSELHRNLYVNVWDEVFPFYYLPESFRKNLRPDTKSATCSGIQLGVFSESPSGTTVTQAMQKPEESSMNPDDEVPDNVSESATQQSMMSSAVD